MGGLFGYRGPGYVTAVALTNLSWGWLVIGPGITMIAWARDRGLSERFRYLTVPIVIGIVLSNFVPLVMLAHPYM